MEYKGTTTAPKIKGNRSMITSPMQSLLKSNTKGSNPKSNTMRPQLFSE
jgi:hypothetical protein